MPAVNINYGMSGMGTSIAQQVSRSADGGSALEIDVPIGYAGVLTTRTDNETGSLTMDDSGHGISTADVIDLYWDGGARYGITVGTVSGTTVPIGADDSGTGDNLPTAATAIVASVQVPFNAAIDGDELSAIGIQMSYAAAGLADISHLSLRDSGSSEIAALDLTANEPRQYDIAGGATNDFTGNPITNGIISNASTAYAAVLKLLWVQDATP